MERKVTFTNLLLKDQVVKVYHFAGMTTAQLPRKGMKTVLSVPEPNKCLIEIFQHEHKSTYGKRLYRCEHVQYS